MAVKIVDVIVEHALYGELVGACILKTKPMENFIQTYRNTNANLYRI